ncbi:telomere-protecting terminal protein Tpg [Streptomyces sp. NPDC001292]|uniref:telomere-protecting terminal protein Tpg n=1 Tax=Streptomyces sp. NPDC001292 TaxID=3364558 RepID=UPI0036B5032B
MKIHNALERADQEAFTREPPKTLKGQIGFLLKRMKSAKAVAAELGITADSVNRYRRGARKYPPKEIQQKIDAAVRSRWQPQVRKRRRKQAASTGGITVETRARFCYTAPIGTTDDGRFRRLTVHLPPSYAQRLFDARDAGASDQHMRQIIADVLRLS